MKNLIFGASALILILSGCTSSPKQRNKIITESAALIQPTQVKLSKFSSYKMLPLKSAEAISVKKEKARYADIIEGKLKERVQPLLAQWNGNSAKNGRKLIVEPELISLRIVSGGARFWIGAMAGSSDVKLRMTLRDAKTNKVIGSPVISKQTGGMTGAWSMGATDKNLVDYIVDISKQYLINNY